MERIIKELESGKLPVSKNENVKVYKDSFLNCNEDKLIMIKENRIDYLLVSGTGKLFTDISGDKVGEITKICETSHENRLILNTHIEYTNPVAFGTEIATFGLGDRLGLASSGHLQLIKDKEIKPILAQQSIREMDLTSRTMNDVIDAACYAVIREGYSGGYGADADHVKKEEHVAKALKLGFSMITLDCSDQIRQDISDKSQEELEVEFKKLAEAEQEYYLSKYLDKTFNIGESEIYFSKETLMSAVLVYIEALKYVEYIYNNYILLAGREIDFELSIDETKTVTTPMEHFLVSKELNDKSVKLSSLAPRFCGEFQKGIDYIGDVDQFEVELKQHANIADYFNYKLSIHSGSDKFTVFPIITKYTKGIFHVKTAGTNWLEGIRVIAEIKPELYREIHEFALDNFEEALKVYDVSADLSIIPDLNTRDDDMLYKYMDEDASRQLLHITYGLILSDKSNGEYVFKDRIYNCLIDEEEAYASALVKHIGRHFQTLNK